MAKIMIWRIAKWKKRSEIIMWNENNENINK